MSNAESRLQIWARSFDGTLDNIFALQDEITVQIVSSVEPELEKAELRRIKTRRPASMGAWDCYLRGREHLHAMTPADNLQARTLFERAIELDPDYAAAAAGLSLTWQRDMLLETAGDRAVCESKALEWARRAVALDAESSLAHYALSGAFIWANEHAHAIAEARTAVQLNPSDTAAWLALANRLDIAGESAKGSRCLRRRCGATRGIRTITPTTRSLDGRTSTRATTRRRSASCARRCACGPTSPTRTMSSRSAWDIWGLSKRLGQRRGDAKNCGPASWQGAHWNIYLDPEANAHLAEGLRKAGLAP